MPTTRLTRIVDQVIDAHDLMPDGHTRIPQRIQHGLDERLQLGRLLRGQKVGHMQTYAIICIFYQN